MAKWIYHASKAITNCVKNINVARDGNLHKIFLTYRFSTKLYL